MSALEKLFTLYYGVRQAGRVREHLGKDLSIESQLPGVWT